ncbi:hypothetical protein HELRODRAFT_175844 [Helobdella robusta]|uniref:Uncharacterized protein n=1 Tax=Helobdella robusta TaxID=6412 RepID=T1F9R6_HELRO|nr:hypothetical protein HELRODRAFT_175844 [Helobdella robusta]ESO00423.1 hypothetical protein HELRODRAFT_175844 [Helobdella robusta]
MSYQHKSGASKRKEKEKRETLARKNQKTCDSFFMINQSSSNFHNESEPEKIENTTLVEESLTVISPEIVTFDVDEGENSSAANNCNKSTLSVYDIGKEENTFLQTKDVHEAVLNGPPTLPKNFPVDFEGNFFPPSALVGHSSHLLISVEVVFFDIFSARPLNQHHTISSCRHGRYVVWRILGYKSNLSQKRHILRFTAINMEKNSKKNILVYSSTS